MSMKRGLEGENVPEQEMLKKTKVDETVEEVAPGEGEGSSVTTVVNEQAETPVEDLTETRILIENHEAGTIIGKGGANVSQIRVESKAFVSILKTESQHSKERVLVLKGTIAANAEAVRLICGLLVDAAVARKNKIAQDSGIENTEPAPSAQIKLLMHKLFAGAVIGKGGSVVNQIKADTGSNISVSTEPLAGSTEKTVTITGTADQVSSAAERVMTQIKENPLRGSATTILYVPGAAALQPSPFGGYNPYGQHPRPPFGVPPQQNSLYGQSSSHGQQQISFSSPHGGGSQFGAPSPYGGGGGGGGGYGQQGGGESKTEKIVIPSVCAGTVIGKGGSIISSIKAQAGVFISIAEPSITSPSDRVVSITGTPQGIQTAIFLIRQRVESYRPPNAPGGPQGQPITQSQGQAPQYGGY